MAQSIDSQKEPLDKIVLNYFDVRENSNKVWIGEIYADALFVAQWGRVRSDTKLQTKSKQFSSVDAARYELENKKREKLRKGYRETQVLSKNEVAATAVNLREIATQQIQETDDPTTKTLIEYLAKINIHTIVSNTLIRYDATSQSFTTPLGQLTPGAIAKARHLLSQILQFDPQSYQRTQLIEDYFRLVPQDFGMKIPDASFLLKSSGQIQAQENLLDALEAALQVKIQEGERIFECRLTKVGADSEQGRQKFRQIRALYERTRNTNHSSARYSPVRLYEVNIPSMRSAFEKTASRLGNVKQHWHGTSAANLLSILKGGLVIPFIAAHGRMFGNGIYGSEQSTKALNYSIGYWGTRKLDRVFALLCDFAMGKEYLPNSYNRSFPVSGFDSTYVKTGTAGVMNQESIVYSTNQVNINYLVEFAALNN
jgi:poly [ADP-ribose] polymerase 2/3/4